MRLSQPTRILIGVLLAFVWLPSVLVLAVVQVFDITAVTSETPRLLGALLTTLLLTDSLRFYTWVGLVLFVVGHTAVSAWQAKSLNLLQLALALGSASFFAALLTLPAYYVLFVLLAERPPWVGRLTLRLGPGEV